ncbi:hypothetical protein I552_6337 [Mycobacterium xenopi 3993]|nr:hypothetical protein I552_6337 [Mycobacterium xenopi 3993]
MSTVELSEMIAESVSEGCWIATNTPGSPGRCKSATALSPTSPSRSVMFARCGWPGGLGATVARSKRRWPTPATPGSPWWILAAGSSGICTSRTCCRWAAGTARPQALIDLSVVRPLPQIPASLPLPEALSRLRRSKSHLALATSDDRKVVAMVALEDLVEDLVGTVRDGTHRV